MLLRAGTDYLVFKGRDFAQTDDWLFNLMEMSRYFSAAIYPTAPSNLPPRWPPIESYSLWQKAKLRYNEPSELSDASSPVSAIKADVGKDPACKHCGDACRSSDTDCNDCGGAFVAHVHPCNKYNAEVNDNDVCCAKCGFATKEGGGEEDVPLYV